MRNYFNYFTETEYYFIQKRDKNLLISPLDWCLVELWRDNGIPLHVVLRGIDRSFAACQELGKKPPTSLRYCHPAVAEAFAEFQESRLGESEEGEGEAVEAPEGLSLDCLDEALGRLEGRLGQRRGEAFAMARQRLEALRGEMREARRIDYRSLDGDLGEIGTHLATDLLREMASEELAEIQERVRRETKVYRKRLGKEMYRKLERSYLHRRVLESHRLPQFTLLAFQDSAMA